MMNIFLNAWLALLILLFGGAAFGNESDMQDLELRYFLSKNSKAYDVEWLVACTVYSSAFNANETKFPNFSAEKRKDLANLNDLILKKLLREYKRAGLIATDTLDEPQKPITEAQAQKITNDLVHDLSQPGLTGPLYNRCITKFNAALAASNDIFYGRVPYQYDEEKSWTKLFSGNQVVTYIDKSSMTRNKNKVRAWLFRRYLEPVCVDNCERMFGTNADAVKFYVDVDCNEGMYRVLGYETRASQGFLDKALISTMGNNLLPLLEMFGAKDEPFTILQQSNKVEDWQTIMSSTDISMQKNLCSKKK